MRHKGLRTRLLATPLHPPMHDGEPVSLAILMADAPSLITTNNIDAVLSGGCARATPPAVGTGMWVREGVSVEELSKWIISENLFSEYQPADAAASNSADYMVMSGGVTPPCLAA